MCQTTYAYTYENTVCACHAVHKQNTLFNNELKTEMTTIIPLANRARSHIALTRPSWVSLASGEREAQPLQALNYTLSRTNCPTITTNISESFPLNVFETKQKFHTGYTREPPSGAFRQSGYTREPHYKG